MRLHPCNVSTTSHLCFLDPTSRGSTTDVRAFYILRRNALRRRRRIPRETSCRKFGNFNITANLVRRSVSQAANLREKILQTYRQRVTTRRRSRLAFENANVKLCVTYAAISNTIRTSHTWKEASSYFDTCVYTCPSICRDSKLTGSFSQKYPRAWGRERTDTWPRNVPPGARGPGHIPRHRPPTRLVPTTLFRSRWRRRGFRVAQSSPSLFGQRACEIAPTTRLSRRVAGLTFANGNRSDA